MLVALAVSEELKQTHRLADTRTRRLTELHFIYWIHKASISLSLNELPLANEQKYDAQAIVFILTKKPSRKVLHL